jgi:hypothetical protein
MPCIWVNFSPTQERHVSKRSIVQFALTFVLVPAIAAAQFTTFIAPPNKVKDSVKAAVVAEQKAVLDSATKAQIADMKTWVDSAAGVTVPVAGTFPTSASGLVDTSVTMLPPERPIFVEGGRAPATASSLPLMLLAGAISMGASLLMFARARREEEALMVEARIRD